MIKPNLKKLNDHGADGSFFKWKKCENIKNNEPFCLKFQKKKIILNYVGAYHTTDKKSDTFRFIKKIITDEKPKIVVIEGIGYNKGINPDISYFQGEGYYAAKIARENKIPYIGIEERDRKIMGKLKKIFSIDDLYGFIFLRTYKYVFKTLKKPIHTLLDDFDMIRSTYLEKIFQKRIEWNYKIWFRKTFNKSFKYGSYLEYSAPYYGKGSNLTQKISYQYSTIRDKYNLKNLYKIMNKYKKIVYIMGMNHVYADKDILLDTFGTYKVITMNNFVE